MTANLKKLRRQHNISQEYLANKLGVSRPTYILIEKGEKELTVKQAKIISELFNIQTQPIPKKSFSAAAPAKKAKKKPKSKLNPNKFKETLLYILEKVGARPNIGETAIYKLLYFIDFDYYEKYGKFLMGATYQKNHYGPTPVQFKKMTDEMIKDGEIEQVKSKYFQYDQKKYLPRREPDLNEFNVTEIKHIDAVLSRLALKSARELSDYSHQDIPWQATKDQDAIDYSLVFYRTIPYAQRDYDKMNEHAALNDVLAELGDISEEESNYYENL